MELAPDGKYHLVLKPGDPRLGTFEADGRLRWPAVDVFGKAVDKNTASVHGLSEAYFVVVPPYSEHLLDVALDGPIAVAPERSRKTADKAPEA